MVLFLPGAVITDSFLMVFYALGLFVAMFKKALLFMRLNLSDNLFISGS